MRFFSIVTAIATIAVLFFVLFQREELLQLAGIGPEIGPEAELAAAEDGAGPSAGDGAGDTAGDTAAPAPVTPASGSAHAPVAVVAAESTAREIDSAVVLRGRTEAARILQLMAETSGKVVSEPRLKGSPVAAGDVLCEIDIGIREAKLAEARARLAEAEAALPTVAARVLEAEAALASAELGLNNAETLAEGGYAAQTRVLAARAGLESAHAAVVAAKAGEASSAAAVEAARAAVAAIERDIANTRVTAPFDGGLESDTAELGSLLGPGGLCATIIDLDPIRLVGFVAEVDVDRVSVGAPVGARLASGREVVGQVTFLSRSADPATRTFRVEAEVPNPDLTIRDGQTAEILIQSAGRMAHLLPQSALTLDDEGNLGVRIVAPAPGGANGQESPGGAEGETSPGGAKGKPAPGGATAEIARFAPVEMLRDTPEGVWVSGLPKTVRVIVTGQDYVNDGVPIRVTMQEPGT